MGNGPVPGVFSLKSDVLVVGEAPGKTEDQEGRPFVGRSGAELSAWLWRAGLNPIDTSYVNVVSCYPGRTPTSQEVELCRPNLLAQMRAADPSYILVLGGVALNAMLPFSSRISDLHGLWWDQEIAPGKSAWATATYHPSATLRNVDLMADAVVDVETFAVIAREEMPGLENSWCGRCKKNDVEVVWGKTMGFCKGCAVMLKVPVAPLFGQQGDSPT